MVTLIWSMVTLINLRKARVQLIPGVKLQDALYVNLSITGLKAALRKSTRPIPFLIRIHSMLG